MHPLRHGEEQNMKRVFGCLLLCTALLTGCGSSSAAPVTESSSAETSDSSAAETTDTTLAETTGTSAAETTADSPALIDRTVFDVAGEGIETTVSESSVMQKGTVGGTAYSLCIDLSKWAHHTTPKQIGMLSRLFWQCYPKMYARYQAVTDAPTDVTLAIENEGYPIAEAGGDFVHLHDMWLHDNPTDYDCITHELAHLIQGSGWDGNYLEFSSYTELFADCCRYEYAMDNGLYNDPEWTLHTPETESSRATSVRFLVWLDYRYSNADIDVLARFFSICHDCSFPTEEWDTAWSYILEDTPLAGMTPDAVWDLYAASDFAQLSAVPESNGTSALLYYYDIRAKLTGDTP